MNSSRGALASALLVLVPGTLGCDDPPECRIEVGITGDITGNANWDRRGADDCGFIDPAPLGFTGVAMVFVRHEEQFVLLMDTPIPEVGNYQGSIIALLDGQTWRSEVGACSVVVSKFDLEGWSLQDFIRIRGTFDCPDPLTAGASEMQLSVLSFDGFLYDEIASSN